jgi:hypothetical protein
MAVPKPALQDATGCLLVGKAANLGIAPIGIHREGFSSAGAFCDTCGESFCGHPENLAINVTNIDMGVASSATLLRGACMQQHLSALGVVLWWQLFCLWSGRETSHLCLVHLMGNRSRPQKQAGQCSQQSSSACNSSICQQLMWLVWKLSLRVEWSGDIPSVPCAPYGQSLKTTEAGRTVLLMLD